MNFRSSSSSSSLNSKPFRQPNPHNHQTKSSGRFKSLPETTKIILVVVATFFTCLIFYLGIRDYHRLTTSSSSSSAGGEDNTNNDDHSFLATASSNNDNGGQTDPPHANNNNRGHQKIKNHYRPKKSEEYDSLPPQALSSNQLVNRFLDKCADHLYPREESLVHHILPKKILSLIAGGVGADAIDELYFPTLSSLRLKYKPLTYCEGYWRDVADDGFNEDEMDKLEKPNERLPFPVKQQAPFCGQEEFLEMLKRVEAKATKTDDVGEMKVRSNTNNEVQYITTRGLSFSRLEKDKVLDSNREYFRAANNRGVNGRYFYDDDENRNPKKGDEEEEEQMDIALKNTFICWTGDLNSHYIGKHNVRPSLDFVKTIIESISI